MIINLKQGSTKADLEKVLERLESKGVERDRVDVSQGDTYVLGIKGDTTKLDENYFSEMLEVEKAIRVSIKWKEISRDFHPENTVIELSNGHKIGQELTIIAGPCAVESYSQLSSSAELVKEAGANVLRGGAYKPRTSPMDFQGMEEEGLEILAKVKEKTGMPIITEIIDAAHIPLFEQYGVDIYQVGARSCQNFRLLKELSKVDKPVLLKRGSDATLNEFLNAACYIYMGENGKGNNQVILCERGGKTSDPVHRNVLNLNNIPYIKQHSHLPVLVDPSHGTGIRSSVLPMAYAGIAAGADGVIVEVHYKPENALCDGQQSINGEIKELIQKATKIYDVLHPIMPGAKKEHDLGQ